MLVGERSRWTEVIVEDVLPSTMVRLAALAATDSRDGLVVIAEHQTGGRGRLDRSWLAAPRAGLSMSALVRPDGVPVSGWTWIPLLAGLAVAAAVQTMSGVGAGLKWPNDVVVDDRKLAGLLVERVETPFGAAALVGIGLNVSSRADELPGASATSVALELERDGIAGTAGALDRGTLAKAILRRLDGLIVAWEAAGGIAGPEMRAAYADSCRTLGRRVRVELPSGEIVHGEAVGIDPDGRLLVAGFEGITALSAGDVVHVRPVT